MKHTKHHISGTLTWLICIQSGAVWTFSQMKIYLLASPYTFVLACQRGFLFKASTLSFLLDVFSANRRIQW